VAVADLLGVPLVATVHATEAGRHAGWLSRPLNQQVHSVEWWLANRADALIACSTAMRAEIAHLFEVDPERISVIHNGIEMSGWRVRPTEVTEFHRRHAADGDPLLLFFGRLEWEKGVQDLIAALPRIRASHPGTRLVVAGRGTQEAELVAAARKHRVRRAVDFVGHLSDRELRAALAAANAVVLPSRYEPFGIAALETAAAGAPLAASTAGGLAEVVVDGRTGVSFPPGDSMSMAAAVGSVLADPTAARRRARAARQRLATDFDWHQIAEATARIYRDTPAVNRVDLGRPKIATGNAFQ
jgi:glycogen(starch) synthase